ncbi:MAG: HPP family protein [Acidiferrobacterales bacterium]
MKIIDEKAKQDIRPYLLQSFLATLTIFFILVFLDVLSHTAIIATLGSSAFLVFTRPRAYASRPRPFVGGYLISMAVGVMFYYATLLPAYFSISVSQSTVLIVFSAMAVGSATLLMVVTDTEHSPAAGMSLGLVLNQWDHKTLLFIFFAVIAMAVLRKILHPYMVDLV